MFKVYDVICVKCRKEQNDLMIDTAEGLPKCDCGGELETLISKMSYKLLYDPKKDTCSWGHENYATSQYWRACNEAKDRGEKVMPVTEIIGDSAVFKKD